jgi:O-antigen/teichoic acid export membrane protein
MLYGSFAGISLTISFFFAVFFFFPAFLVRLLKQTYDKRKKTFIFGFTGVCLLVISAMFTRMHWPGPSEFTLIAIVCICISVFPLKSSKKTDSHVR